jgi:hypothetical protein
MTHVRTTSFASILLLAGACSGSGETGLAVRAVTASSHTADAPKAVTDQGGSSYTLVEAWLHLRHIELDLPVGVTCGDVEADLAGGAYCDPNDDLDDDSPEDKIKIDGPFIVDMITGETTPSLADVRVPALAYSRIDVRVDDGDPQEGLVEVGSALDDATYVVAATFDYQGTTTELRFRLNFDEDIRIEQPGGIDLAGDENLVAEFVVDSWLAGVDIAGCIDDGDLAIDGGVVAIDDRNDGACGGIEDTIKNNMKNSGRLGHD